MKKDQNNIILLRELSAHVHAIISIIRNSYEKKWLIGSIYLSPAIEYYIKSLSGSPDDEFYGIANNGEMIAFMHLKGKDTGIFVNNIGVLPQYNNLGFGNSLLKFAIEKAVSEGKSIALHVNSNNKKAITWYNKRGFYVESQDRYSLLSINKKSEVKFRFSSVTFEDRSFFYKYGFGFGYITWKEKIIKIGILPSNYIKILNHEVLSEEDIIELHKKWNCNLIIPRGILSKYFDSSSTWSVFTMKYRYD